MTFAEDASAEAVFAAGSMHELGGKRVEVKPATPKGSGSLGRPSGSSSAPPRPGTSGSSGRGSMGLPPFGGAPGPVVGSPGALFGSPPSPYAAAGFGMFGYPHAGVPERAGEAHCCKRDCSTVFMPCRARLASQFNLMWLRQDVGRSQAICRIWHPLPLPLLTPSPTCFFLSPAGMVPTGPGFGMQYGGMAQQYGGMSHMGGMGGMGPSPYMMMGGQIGGYVPGAAAYGFPTSAGMAAPAFPPQHPAGGSGHYGGTPFAQPLQPQHSQQQYPR